MYYVKVKTPVICEQSVYGFSGYSINRFSITKTLRGINSASVTFLNTPKNFVEAGMIFSIYYDGLELFRGIVSEPINTSLTKEVTFQGMLYSLLTKFLVNPEIFNAGYSLKSALNYFINTYGGGLSWYINVDSDLTFPSVTVFHKEYAYDAIKEIVDMIGAWMWENNGTVYIVQAEMPSGVENSLAVEKLLSKVETISLDEILSGIAIADKNGNFYLYRAEGSSFAQSWGKIGYYEYPSYADKETLKKLAENIYKASRIGDKKIDVKVAGFQNVPLGSVYEGYLVTEVRYEYQANPPLFLTYFKGESLDS